jgi:hypothetical protein
MNALPMAMGGSMRKLALISVLGWPIKRCDKSEIAPSSTSRGRLGKAQQR